MLNIFIVLFTLTLAFAFFDPNFFVSYLISIAVFGLFQAMYMANAGGAWDNAKKLIESNVTIDGVEYGKGLQLACMECHSNKEKFCDSCHDYAAVQPTCWECHITPTEAAKKEAQ